MSELTDGLYLAIGALALLTLARLYRDYRHDKVRDDLFTLRDQLFDYAVDNDLLEHPGYRKLRDIMNAMIRFAHKISITRLVLSMALDRFIPKSERRHPFDEWMSDVQNLPPHLRDKLVNFHIEAGLIIIKYAIENSILARIGVMLARVLLLIRNFYLTAGDAVLKKIMIKTSHGWQLIEGQALDASR